MGEKNEQVIPNTESVNVAYIAAALEIARMASSRNASYGGMEPEEIAEKLAQLFVIARKGMLAKE